ncbi:MAG: hypothetical protein R2762_10110 [Bryobacteraceae bacterium]
MGRSERTGHRPRLGLMLYFFHQLVRRTLIQRIQNHAAAALRLVKPLHVPCAGSYTMASVAVAVQLIEHLPDERALA